MERSAMPKVINNSQILGHRGENLIKDLALEMGITYERVSIDAGICYDDVTGLKANDLISIAWTMTC